MTAFNQKIQTLLDKGQGPAARALDRLPRLAQESLAKILGYSYQYPDLDSFTKCMMAVQIKCKVHLRAAYNSQFFFSTCVSLVVFCSNSGTNSAIFY